MGSGSVEVEPDTDVIALVQRGCLWSSQSCKGVPIVGTAQVSARSVGSVPHVEGWVKSGDGIRVWR